MAAPSTYPYVCDLSSASLSASPDCFARIIRFVRRDTREYVDKRPVVKINEGKNKGSTANPGGIRHSLDKDAEEKKTLALDIASDILQCTISKSKSSPVGTFTLVLSAGDINYHHAINPGDHVCIWMRRNKRKLGKVLVDSGKSSLIGKNVEDGYANNSMDSGLKMYGVITSVRRTFKTEPSGRKLLLYTVSGKDFGYFFEASIYYNQAAVGLLSDSKFFEFTGFGTVGAPLRPDEIVSRMLDIYFGSKYLEDFAKLKLKDRKGRPVRPYSENRQMYIPGGIQDIFGIKQSEFVAMLDKRIGIEQYITASSRPDCFPLEGVKAIHIDVGSHYPVWSALRAYSNSTINEMFLDLKVRENGKLYPTFICRQIPFTSTRAAQAIGNSTAKVTTTRFLELPRVKIPESFIIAEDMGRGDHERFNFIELFGRFPGMEELVPVMIQMYQGNYAIDITSVKRYGLRPMIVTSDFHFPNPAAIDATKAIKKGDEPRAWTMVPKWINLLADWYLAAHTLESGTIQTVGIEEPITLGDNIEVVRQKGVNELYHIEGYTHSYSVDMGSGKKTFRTSIEVSRGQRVDEYPLYVSETLNEDDLYAIGLSDHEETGMARPETSATHESTGISKNEIPKERKLAPSIPTGKERGSGKGSI